MSNTAVIALDDESTWPPELRQVLDGQLNMLRAYESAPSTLLSNIERIIRDAALVGFHCTRLHDDEIESVQEHGLRPLSPELARERVSRRVAADDLPPEVADQLLAKSRADDRHPQERRTNMIWFIFTKGPLRNEGGVWRLFTFWGGEALYLSVSQQPVAEGVGRARLTKRNVLPSHRASS